MDEKNTVPAVEKDSQKKEAKLTYFMLSQNYNPELWDWTDSEKNALWNEDCRMTAETIKRRLEGGGLKIAEMYAVTHDKDEKKLWDECDRMYKFHSVHRHIHAIVKFQKGGGATLKKAAELIGITPNFIEKPRAGKYGYDNCLSYLIHIKYADKYRYDPHLVETLAGRPYIEHYQERHEAWIRGRAFLMRKTSEELLNEILMRIIEEPDFTKKDIARNKEYRKVYILYSSKIDKAFENRSVMTAFATWYG